MTVEGGNVALSPGMAVTVEIKTGAQRVITDLLSPMLGFAHDSLHEREPKSAAIPLQFRCGFRCNSAARRSSGIARNSFL